MADNLFSYFTNRPQNDPMTALRLMRAQQQQGAAGVLGVPGQEPNNFAARPMNGASLGTPPQQVGQPDILSRIQMAVQPTDNGPSGTISPARPISLSPRPYVAPDGRPAGDAGDAGQGLLAPPASQGNEGAPPPINQSLIGWNKDSGTYDTRAQTEQQAQARGDFLRSQPVVDKDHGFLGRLGDVLRQALVSGGQAWNQSGGRDMYGRGMDPWQRLAGAIGGAAAGGAYGGFHPEVDEERQRQYEIAQNEGDLDRIRGDQDRTLKMQATQAQLGHLNAETQNLNTENTLKAPVTVMQPKLDGYGRPVIGPDNQPVMEPHTLTGAEASQYTATTRGQTQNSDNIHYTQQQENQRQANQIASTEGQKAADRELTVSERNQAAQNEAQIKNVANQMDWATKEQARLKEVITGLGENQAGLLNVNGALDRAQVAQQNLAQIQDDLSKLDPATDKAAYLQKQSEAQKAIAAFDTAQKDMYTAAGKSKMGDQIVQSLRPMPKPPAIKPQLITAPKTSVSKPTSNNPLGLIIR